MWSKWKHWLQKCPKDIESEGGRLNLRNLKAALVTLLLLASWKVVWRPPALSMPAGWNLILPEKIWMPTKTFHSEMKSLNSALKAWKKDLSIFSINLCMGLIPGWKFERVEVLGGREVELQLVNGFVGCICLASQPKLRQHTPTHSSFDAFFLNSCKR